MVKLTYLLKKGGHAPPFASRSEFARLIPRGRALCAHRSAFNLPRLIEMIPRADPVARGGDLDILVLTSPPLVSRFRIWLQPVSLPGAKRRSMWSCSIRVI